MHITRLVLVFPVRIQADCGEKQGLSWPLCSSTQYLGEVVCICRVTGSMNGQIKYLLQDPFEMIGKFS